MRRFSTAFFHRRPLLIVSTSAWSRPLAWFLASMRLVQTATVAVDKRRRPAQEWVVKQVSQLTALPASLPCACSPSVHPDVSFSRGSVCLTGPLVHEGCRFVVLYLGLFRRLTPPAGVCQATPTRDTVAGAAVAVRSADRHGPGRLRSTLVSR